MAARDLFARVGYVATTMNAIAEAADIPVQTIYSSMGSKAKILEDTAWRVAGALDIDRHHQEARVHPDPAQGLRLAAALQRRQYEAMYDVIAAYQEAARTEPDIARSTQIIQTNREAAFRQHLETIERHLRPDLTVPDALDRYLALVLPEIYRTLVRERGWAPDRYQTWLGDHLVTELLGR